MNESRALKLCVKYRDPIGFEFLVRQYERQAFAHARALLGSREDAADACQEAFARSFASLSRLDALDSFYPWFYRILRNHCLNLLSRRRTADAYANQERFRDGTSAPSAEAMASDDEEVLRIRNALAVIKPEFREILTLKISGDYDYQTLSELIGIPRGTVMSRLYHARKALQAALNEADGAPQADQTGDFRHAEM